MFYLIQDMKLKYFQDNDYNQMRQRHSHGNFAPMLAPSPSGSHSEEEDTSIGLNPIQSPNGSGGIGGGVVGGGREKINHFVSQSESETDDRSNIGGGGGGGGDGNLALNRSKHYFSDGDNDLDGSKASPASTKMSLSSPQSQLEPIPSQSQSTDSAEFSHSPVNNVEGGPGPSSRLHLRMGIKDPLKMIMDPLKMIMTTTTMRNWWRKVKSFHKIQWSKWFHHPNNNKM